MMYTVLIKRKNRYKTEQRRGVEVEVRTVTAIYNIKKKREEKKGKQPKDVLKHYQSGEG